MGLRQLTKKIVAGVNATDTTTNTLNTGTLHTTGTRLFRWDEIESSGTRLKNDDASKFIVINDKVYDIGGDFVKWHPGGDVVLSQLGKDATGAFDIFHASSTHEVIAKWYVGDLAPGQIRKKSGFFEEVTNLREEYERKGYYKSSKLYYAFKLIFNQSLWLTSLLIMMKWSSSTIALMVSALFMALFFQQSGWLSHDLLHNQVFEKRLWNKALAYFTGSACQGFSVSWWVNKHSTHHSAPNVHTADPDIDTMPFLAWSEHALELFTEVDDAALAQFLIKYQPYLYAPILTFARLSWCYSSTMYVAHNPEIANRRVEMVTLAIHWIWYLGFVSLYCSPLGGLLWIFISQSGCGVMLASVFSLNHNGMPVLNQKQAKQYDFYTLQVITGRDVRPSLVTNFFTGGLNYQVEHHMFPTLPRHNFHLVREDVIRLCKKHKIPYHYTTFWQGTIEVLSRLADISRTSVEMKKEKYKIDE